MFSKLLNQIQQDATWKFVLLFTGVSLVVMLIGMTCVCCLACFFLRRIERRVIKTAERQYRETIAQGDDAKLRMNFLLNAIVK